MSLLCMESFFVSVFNQLFIFVEISLENSWPPQYTLTPLSRSSSIWSCIIKSAAFPICHIQLWTNSARGKAPHSPSNTNVLISLAVLSSTHPPPKGQVLMKTLPTFGQAPASTPHHPAGDPMAPSGGEWDRAVLWEKKQICCAFYLACKDFWQKLKSENTQRCKEKISSESHKKKDQQHLYSPVSKWDFLSAIGLYRRYRQKLFETSSAESSPSSIKNILLRKQQSQQLPNIHPHPFLEMTRMGEH